MRRWSLLISLLLIAAAAIASGIYKWVDDQGTTHYSDAVPKAQKATELDHPTEPPTVAPDNGAGQSTEDWALKNQAFKERHKARQEQLDDDLRQQRLSAELTEIRQGARTPVPGSTGAGPELQRIVLQWLVKMDSARDLACTSHRMIGSEIAERYRHSRTVVEYWTLDRCGRPVRYRVTFNLDAEGRVSTLVQAEKSDP